MPYPFVVTSQRMGISKTLSNKVLDKWGRLDVLFNNAGISFPETRIDKVTSRDWRKIINVNLTGAFICAREAF